MDTSRFPVESISWYDAVAFCNKLSEREGRHEYYRMSDLKRHEERIITASVKVLGGDGYRLLTEAEWEYACRAGTTTVYHFGDDASQLGDYAWFEHTKNALAGDYAHRVNSMEPNAFGLYDMHGNVEEWCNDWYDLDYANSATDDPSGSARGVIRVYRGGSWYDFAKHCRSAYRRAIMPDFRNYCLGFRVARLTMLKPASAINLRDSPGESAEPADLADSVPTPFVNAPKVTAADVKEALDDAQTMARAWNLADEADYLQLLRQTYFTLARLGEVITFAAPSIQPDRMAVAGLLMSLAKDDEKLAVLGKAGEVWLRSQRDTAGVLLLGAVKSIEKQGDLYETKLAMSGGGSPISLCTDTDLADVYQVDSDVLVLGAIIDSPAANLKGYKGDAESVVWCRLVWLVTKERQRSTGQRVHSHPKGRSLDEYRKSIKR